MHLSPTTPNSHLPRMSQVYCFFPVRFTVKFHLMPSWAQSCAFRRCQWHQALWASQVVSKQMPRCSAGVAATGLGELFLVLLFCFSGLLVLYPSYLGQENILHLCTAPGIMGHYLTYSCVMGGLLFARAPWEKEVRARLVAAYSYLFEHEKARFPIYPFI